MAKTWENAFLHYFKNFNFEQCLSSRLPARRKNRNVSFSTRVWRKIVYAPREENWPTHISCLPPSPSVRMAIYTSCGLSKFFPPYTRCVIHYTHFWGLYLYVSSTAIAKRFWLMEFKFAEIICHIIQSL